MYFDNDQGGHDTLATAEPGKTWYLAAGSSRTGFDTWLLEELKEMECPFAVGLTAEGTTEKEFALHRKAMGHGLDFISYNISHLPNAFVTAERERGIPVISWTVRTPEQAVHSRHNADQITFEGFDPKAA